MPADEGTVGPHFGMDSNPSSPRQSDAPSRNPPSSKGLRGVGGMDLKEACAPFACGLATKRITDASYERMDAKTVRKNVRN